MPPFVSLPLNLAASLILLLFRVPLLGRLLGQGGRLLQEAFSHLLNVADLFLRAAGIRLQKTLRLHLIVLRDRGVPVVLEDALQPQIETVQLALAAAGIVLKARIHFDNRDAPPTVLDVGCNARAYWEDLWTPGRFFETAAQRHAADTALLRLLGVGSPLFAFVVRSMAGCFIGCSLGAAADYVTLVGKALDDPRLLAHEIGHALGLLHRRDRENLMCPFLGGTALTAWQCAVIRGSRHVTYL